MGAAHRPVPDRACRDRGRPAPSFRPEPGIEEELRRLIAVERECCSWAAWTVETNVGAPMLDVRSTGPGIATLHGMFRPGKAAC